MSNHSLLSTLEIMVLAHLPRCRPSLTRHYASADSETPCLARRETKFTSQIGPLVSLRTTWVIVLPTSEEYKYSYLGKFTHSSPLGFFKDFIYFEREGREGEREGEKH